MGSNDSAATIDTILQLYNQQEDGKPFFCYLSSHIKLYFTSKVAETFDMSVSFSVSKFQKVIFHVLFVKFKR